MRLVLISDTHTIAQGKIVIPEGDLLVHAGDFCGWSTLDDVRSFARWFKAQPCTWKACVAGNHDKPFDRAFSSELEVKKARNILELAGIHYMQDGPGGIPIDWARDGYLNLWGSPWQPPFCNWAFNEPEGLLAGRWARIPGHTDVLVTHGPAWGYGDKNLEGEHCGSRSLRDWLEAQAKTRPIPLHVFGHIHEAAGQGVYPWGGRWVNASVLNRNYEVANAPVVVDIEILKCSGCGTTLAAGDGFEDFAGGAEWCPGCDEVVCVDCRRRPDGGDAYCVPCIEAGDAPGEVEA